MRKITFLFILIYISRTAQETQTRPTGLVATKAMVVSAREEASKIGVEIMKKGGNAFDAMVGTELALAVSFPFAGNITWGIYGLPKSKRRSRIFGLSRESSFGKEQKICF